MQSAQYGKPQPAAKNAAWWQKSGSSPCTLRAAWAVSCTMSASGDIPLVTQRGRYILMNRSWRDERRGKERAGGCGARTQRVGKPALLENTERINSLPTLCKRRGQDM